MTVTATEFPFIKVTVDTRGLQPTARRATGDVAVVGSTDGGGTVSTAVPTLIGSELEARQKLATLDEHQAVTKSGRLYQAVRAALLQGPAPSRVYAVATAKDANDKPDYAGALAALEATSVQFVCLAGETDVTALGALKTHIENVSQAGDRRIGVAMVDPDLTVASTSTFADTADNAYKALKSALSRMILVAARVPKKDGVVESDVAAAAMGAIAGFPPHVSVLLKQLREVTIPRERQFSASEITALTDKLIIPVIDPELIPGEGLFLGSGRCYTSDTSRLYVDIVRVLDNIEFLLKAGLIGSIGNVRIDRLGMQALRARIDGILGPLQSAEIIDAYTIDIPLLPILQAEEATRSPGQTDTLREARTSRTVEVLLSVTYAGAIHFLDVQLALKA
jgi:hypothetical protein